MDLNPYKSPRGSLIQADRRKSRYLTALLAVFAMVVCASIVVVMQLRKLKDGQSAPIQVQPPVVRLASGQ